MPATSYVIWFHDGQYTYAWGSSPEDALARYLANWQRGITTMVTADTYLDALPPHRYLPSPSNAIWPDVEAIPGSPLYGPGAVAHAGAPPPAPPAEPSLAEAVAILQSQVERLVNSQVVVGPAGCEAVLTEPEADASAYLVRSSVIDGGGLKVVRPGSEVALDPLETEHKLSNFMGIGGQTTL